MCDHNSHTAPDGIDWLNTLIYVNKDLRAKKKKALNYARDNFAEIFHQGEYVHLGVEVFKELLDSDDINVQSEETIVESIKNWLKCNDENLSEDVCSLLEIVRFPLLSLKYILNEVETLVSVFPCSRKIVMDAIRWHIFPEERSNFKFRLTPRKFAFKLLALGSNNFSLSNVVELYDSTINKWTQLKHTKLTKAAFGVAMIDGRVMIIGGTTDPDGNNSVDTVESLDLSTGVFETLEPLKDKRRYPATAVVGKGQLATLYVIGGWGAILKQLASVERWDPINKTWSMVASMIVPRSGCACAVLDETIYSGGGRVHDNYVNSFEMYDVKENTWTMKAPMIQSRAYGGMTSAGGKVYLIGGSERYLYPINNVDRYDPNSDTWTRIANISSSGVVAVITVRNKPLVVGGKSSKNVEEYDEENDKWVQLAPLNVAREGYVVEIPTDTMHLNFSW